MRGVNVENFTKIRTDLLSATGFQNEIRRNLEFMRILTNLTILCEEEKQHIRKTSPVPEVYTDIVQYIYDNYGSPVSVSELAAMSGYSEVQFSRNFKKYYGFTPYQYIINVRLQNAASMLRETDCSVEYISDVNNFSSTSNFIDKFMETYGITPKKYRIRESQR